MFFYGYTEVGWLEKRAFLLRKGGISETRNEGGRLRNSDKNRKDRGKV